MRELIDILNYHTDLYNQGKPQITDKQWDDMFFELRDLEVRSGIVYPNSPSQTIREDKVEGLKEQNLLYRMLSLAKTKSLADVASFIAAKSYVMSLKLDGLSCQLVYRDGKLESATTRGNGHIGSDVLHNARVIHNIPKRIPYQGCLIVCGEVVCKYKDFEPFSANYSNPRNFASGSLKLLDAKESRKRNLSFVAWDLAGQDDWFKTLSAKFDFLLDMGFEVVPHKLQMVAPTKKEIADMRFEAIGVYPIDGIVIKYDNCADGQGETAHHPNNAISYKFYDDEYETTLIDIEWGMGRNGQITPVAIFEPIAFPDSIVERASLHNISIMKDIFDGLPFKNQKIKVVKANEIIPQVIDARNEKGEWINEIKTKIS